MFIYLNLNKYKYFKIILNCSSFLSYILYVQTVQYRIMWNLNQVIILNHNPLKMKQFYFNLDMIGFKVAAQDYKNKIIIWSMRT